MRSILIITSIVFGFSFVHGQEIDMTDEIMIRSTTDYEIVGQIKETTMLILEDNGFYKVHAFDEKLHKTWDKTLRMERKTAIINGFIPRRDNLSMYYSYRFKGENFIKMRRLDEKLNIIDSTTIKKFSRRPLSPKTRFEYSKNKKKVLLYSIDNINEFEITVVDDDSMEVELDTKIKVESATYQNEFLQAIVDNNGDVYLIFEKDNKKSKRENNIFKVVHFNAGSDQPRFFTISLNSNLWYDVGFSYDNMNDRLLIGGLYSVQSVIDAHGVFYMSVSPTNPDEQTSNFTPFTKEYLKLVLGKEVKKNVGFDDVVVQEMIPRHDGGVLMIAERFKEQVRDAGSYERYYDGRNNVTRATDYFYNEILLFSFHPTGEVHWKEILHKKQYSQDDGGVFSSFFVFLNKANVRFLYNDTIKREDTVYEYVVGGSGSSERNSLFNTKEDKLMLRLPDAMQISSNEILVPSERRNAVKVVKLTF